MWGRRGPPTQSQAEAAGGAGVLYFRGGKGERRQVRQLSQARNPQVQRAAARGRWVGCPVSPTPVISTASFSSSKSGAKLSLSPGCPSHRALFRGPTRVRRVHRAWARVRVGGPLLGWQAGVHPLHSWSSARPQPSSSCPCPSPRPGLISPGPRLCPGAGALGLGFLGCRGPQPSRWV